MVRYVNALLSRDFTAAWNLLSAETQAAFGSATAFADDRAAFLTTARNEIEYSAPRHDPAELDEWLPMLAGADVDRQKAYLVRLEYPALADTTNSWELLLVAPNAAGEWRIWIVR